MVAPLALAIGYEVFSRYVMGAPTIWAFELGYMLTGANFLLGAPLVLRMDGHIRVDVLYGRYSERARALVNALTHILIVIPFSAWLAWSLWHYALDAYVSGEGSGMSAWNPPVWPFRTVFFVSFAVLGLQALAELVRCLDVLFARSGAAEGAALGFETGTQPRGQ
ncbi:TRAP transporter small permease subunit [Azospirillum sp. ST 5-10]|uniref:TRAP transporter small permease subunit n=1 Tax=unclassified Azospirillum TaxID=2630922 RepID=UPI003F4A1970